MLILWYKIFIPIHIYFVILYLKFEYLASILHCNFVIYSIFFFCFILYFHSTEIRKGQVFACWLVLVLKILCLVENRMFKNIYLFCVFFLLFVSFVVFYDFLYSLFSKLKIENLLFASDLPNILVLTAEWLVGVFHFPRVGQNHRQCRMIPTTIGKMTTQVSPSDCST